MRPRTTTSISLAFALSLLASTSSFAADADAFADRLQAVLKQYGLSLAFSGSEAQGDHVTITGASFGVGDDRVDVGDLRFENVTGSAEQGFEAARVSVETIGKRSADTAWTAKDLIVEDVRLGGTSLAPPTPLPGDLFIGRLGLAQFTSTRNNRDDFKLTGLEIRTAVGEGGSVTSQMDFGTFRVDLSPHERTDFVTTLEELGYESFTGSASGTATWQPSTSEWRLEPFHLSIDNAGQYEASMTVGGVTRNFAESLTAFLEDEDPSTISILGPIAHLSLQHYRGAYSDEGLANRLVDFYAKENDLTREDALARSGTIVPDLLGELENEAFQNAIGSAVSSFLMDPASKVLSFSIQPENPVPGALILAFGIGNPEALPDLLRVRVTADQKTSSSRAQRVRRPPSPPSSEDAQPQEAATLNSPRTPRDRPVNPPLGLPGKTP